MSRRFYIKNTSLLQLLQSDFRFQRGVVSHPFLNLAALAASPCCACAQQDECPALGHVAALQTQFPITALVRTCRWFTPSGRGRPEFIIEEEE